MLIQMSTSFLYTPTALPRIRSAMLQVNTVSIDTFRFRQMKQKPPKSVTSPCRSSMEFIQKETPPAMNT